MLSLLATSEAHCYNFVLLLLLAYGQTGHRSFFFSFDWNPHGAIDAPIDALEASRSTGSAICSTSVRVVDVDLPLNGRRLLL